jgi:hypothetical protein
MDYKEQLKDPRWQKKRLEVLEKVGWGCELCKKDKDTLHVHHLEYKTGMMPWEYGDEDLIVLDEGCHKAIHHANLSRNMVEILREQFKAGERYAIKMFSMNDEGSPERVAYLEQLTQEK